MLLGSAWETLQGLAPFHRPTLPALLCNAGADGARALA